MEWFIGTIFALSALQVITNLNILRIGVFPAGKYRTPFIVISEIIGGSVLVIWAGILLWG